MAEILKGAPVAQAITEKLRERIESLAQRGVVPGLAILRVGEREDDISYEKAAMKRCAGLGIRVKNALLPLGTTQETLMQTIAALNADGEVHGILMFRPLPGKLDERAACEAIAPDKDIDGISSLSMAGVYSGAGTGYPPCTAQACMETLKFYGIDPAGKRAVVIGRSLVIGRPAALLLLGANATVTLCHTKSADMPSIAREADILLVAAGRAGVVDKSYLRAGQIVLDVGVNWDEKEQRLRGDVRFDEAESIVRAVTPVPGGIGSVTTSVLASHVVEAAERKDIK